MKCPNTDNGVYYEDFWNCRSDWHIQIKLFFLIHLQEWEAEIEREEERAGERECVVLQDIITDEIMSD